MSLYHYYERDHYVDRIQEYTRAKYSFPFSIANQFWWC